MNTIEQFIHELEQLLANYTVTTEIMSDVLDDVSNTLDNIQTLLSDYEEDSVQVENNDH